MDLYISQLISDIRQATWRVRPPNKIWEGVDPENEIELEDLSYVEEYIHGTPEKISTITGIALEFLPPPEKLNDEQAGRLAAELEKLLNCFHFYPDFPESFPMHLRYPFIWDLWDEERVPLSFGESHIEFCDYEEESCPFPGYCFTCKEFAAQMEYDERIQKQSTSKPYEDEELLF